VGLAGEHLPPRARPPVGVEGAAVPAPRGLSLFLVSKHHVDLETGELGARNGVVVTGVEKKMGLKVSTTVRGHLRREGAGGRHARRRRAQRHRADVRGHRERPHVRRRQGHLDAVDRLPQRARVRQAARAGRRHDAHDRQDRAARADRRTPDVRLMLMRQKAWAEGLRRSSSTPPRSRTASSSRRPRARSTTWRCA
jgi:hypothetical protein